MCKTHNNVVPTVKRNRPVRVPTAAAALTCAMAPPTEVEIKWMRMD